MNRMGFFLTLTIAMLLTSLIRTHGAEKLKIKRDCPSNCVTCGKGPKCGCCDNARCINELCQIVGGRRGSNRNVDYYDNNN
uniref:Conotoxin n=1 Tax=Conus praecellens TaxID=128530 RepID=A0A291C2Z3_CONPC|nr:conotoxin [Conus praecellens]